MGAAPLPYDMGNAGDLLKHGLLAEFTCWWCKQNDHPIKYLDPFAGRPWLDGPNSEVARRVESLPKCALSTVQPTPRERYYGSTLVVAHAAQAAGSTAEIWISDANDAALEDFAYSGRQFLPLDAPGFSARDGFSALGCNLDADLLLLDPFAEFLPRSATSEIPRIAEASTNTVCVLFVLNRDPENAVGQRYRQLREQHLPSAWELHCPKLVGTSVRGESGYEVEVLLAWLPLQNHPERHVLEKRLRLFASAMSEALGAPVKFSAPN